ncbi:hypothetical protein LSAT2_026099 [Lamellibrachia satsuma]|nr:hypothetical protein LSAT2_026099 [Lamellibrachia satsuma]
MNDARADSILVAEKKPTLQHRLSLVTNARGPPSSRIGTMRATIVMLLLTATLSLCYGNKVCDDRTIYDAATTACCGGQLYKKEKDWKCCGGEWVSRKKYLCFLGFIPSRKMKSCYGLHFRQHYDPEKEICCDKTSYQKTPTLDCCCGVILYNPTISTCDAKNHRVIMKQAN